MVDTMKLRRISDTTVFKDTNIVASSKRRRFRRFCGLDSEAQGESDGRIHNAEDLRKYIYEIIPGEKICSN